MRSFGLFLVVAAVLSYVLPKIGLQLLLFSWVDNWGLTTGIAIRVGLAIVGALLIGADYARRGGAKSA